MSQNQLDKYFKDSIELIFNNSKDYFKNEEMTDEDYRTCMGDILKTFINKFHTYQSQLLFSSLSNVEVDVRKPELNYSDFDTSNILSNANLNDTELNDTICSPSEEPISPTFNITDIINQHQNSQNPESEPEEISGSYSSEPEFETQCCARIGNEWFKIDDYSAEFLDKYPAGVFITSDGYVVGKPCHKMIPDEEFDEGNIFCEHHIMNGDFEDIREPPDDLKNND